MKLGTSNVRIMLTSFNVDFNEINDVRKIIIERWIAKTKCRYCYPTENRLVSAVTLKITIIGRENTAMYIECMRSV